MYGRTDYDGVGVAGNFRILILDGTPGILCLKFVAVFLSYYRQMSVKSVDYGKTDFVKMLCDLPFIIRSTNSLTYWDIFIFSITLCSEFCVKHHLGWEFMLSATLLWEFFVRHHLR